MNLDMQKAKSTSICVAINIKSIDKSCAWMQYSLFPHPAHNYTTDFWKARTFPGFPGSSAGKESACNVGDHSNILPEESPWTEEPGGLHSMGS